MCCGNPLFKGSVADRGRNPALRGSKRDFGPSVFADDQNIRPTEGRGEREQVFKIVNSGLPAFGEDIPKLFCIPIGDDGGEQVQARDAVFLGPA